MRLQLSRAADDHLEAIADCIAQDKPAIAIRFVDKLPGVVDGCRNQMVDIADGLVGTFGVEVNW